MDALLAYTERMTRRLIAGLPDGAIALAITWTTTG